MANVLGALGLSRPESLIDPVVLPAGLATGSLLFGFFRGMPDFFFEPFFADLLPFFIIIFLAMTNGVSKADRGGKAI